MRAWSTNWLGTGRALIGAAFFLAATTAHGQAVSDTGIGHAERVLNVVMAMQGNAVRTIHMNDRVFQNELIRTNDDSEVDLVFADDSRLTVGPRSRVMLDDFIYNPDSQGGQFVMQISVGTMRYVSGKLPKKAFSLKTPAATIGIRGTDFEVAVADDGGTDVFVRSGAVQFSNLAGESVELGPGERANIRPPSSNGRQAPPTPPQRINSRGSRRADAGPGGRGAGSAGGGGGGSSGSGGGFNFNDAGSGGGGGGAGGAAGGTGAGGETGGGGTGGGQLGSGTGSGDGQVGGGDREPGFADLIKVFRYALKDRDLLNFSPTD